MANAENHSYPPTGFTRSSREMPGARFEEMRRDDTTREMEQENLVGKIREVMHDQTGPTADLTKGKLRPKRELVSFFKKSAAPAQHGTSKSESKARPMARGIFRKVMSYLLSAIWRMLKPGLAKLKSYRPTRKHIGFAVLAVIVLLRPWLIPITVLVLLMIAVIAWLSLGPDRVSELISGLWLRLRARNPEQAEKIRNRFQAGVKWINKVLNWMPGRWAERVRLTDYTDSDEERPQDEIRNLPDPFDKLATEARQRKKAEQPSLRSFGP